ncbi:LuxR family transcriptional regulator [Serratia proteamaculans]|uniref:LuxR family transcriptional regulator n=1 Tax=Serratia proteamaculans TaxID=28151 RepID=UPI001FD23EE2|nr:LuxR family transcriptional regulator [Serratia proteamaculans]
MTGGLRAQASDGNNCLLQKPFLLFSVLAEMKKILLMSQCQFTRLALKAVFENKTGYEMAFIGPDYFSGGDVGQAIVLIHITDDDYPTILPLLRNAHFYGHRDIIFIAQKRVIAIMEYLSMKTLRFIEEEAGVEVFEREVIEGGDFSGTKGHREVLSFIEYSVLKLVILGMSPTNIAFRTRKSIKTISSQKIKALKKLGLDNTPYSLVKLSKLFN